MLKILVTGGAGYIGAHTVLVLLEAGFDVVVVDNLSNSSSKSLERVEQITGKTVNFIECDIRNSSKLSEVFTEHQINQVIHFAGLKSVSESYEQPLVYYDNNVAGTVSLLQVMEEANVKKIIFSSSATVYGDSNSPPYRETFGRGKTTNPYGSSKAMTEQILEDLAQSDPNWSVSLLRYFNPVGAHFSGLIGENPTGVPNNLMPFITQVAVGQRKELSVFGSDYDTPDGTCLRDYIHVMDLAEGHLAALQNLKPGCAVFNLGTGVPVSVLEMVKVFESQNGIVLPHKFVERRCGDIAAVWADTTKARTLLNWHANRDLANMVRSSWNWQQKNPHGYE